LGTELAGKVAIVTGGASGLGRGTVELFVQEGARVVIADLNDAAGNALAEQLGDAACFKHSDVSSPEDMQALVDFAVAKFGGLDIMCNNAGMPSSPQADFLDDPLLDFTKVMNVNVYGVMLGTQRAARHMARHGGGVIINTSSIAGAVKGLAVMTYRASKAAVIHFSQSVAIDLAQYDIRVNCIVPGHIRTAISNTTLDAMTPEQTIRVDAATQPVWDMNKPLKRTGVPGDVAQAALFLASDRSAYITGVMLPVDAGVSIGDTVNHLRQLRAAQAQALADE
jgi:NAD(P)-dependent dehydrogenase (short-subunit alcohol dehydrogenase family)